MRAYSDFFISVPAASTPEALAGTSHFGAEGHKLLVTLIGYHKYLILSTQILQVSCIFG